MIPKNISGKLGEKYAAQYLQKNGYRIICSNYKSAGAEIDIIATEKDVLCFIEVKTRKNKEFGNASQAVDKRKMKKMILGARSFMMTNSVYKAFRFDVVEVYGEVKTAGFSVNEINIIKNAFEA